MPTLGWTESVPSNTSAVNQYPAFAKSVWTSISLGMAVEHYWNASGGGSDASIGELLPGSSRAFVAALSASSAPNSQMTGRLFLTSDTSRLLVYDSSGTYLVGTPFLQEHATDAKTGYWLRQSGSYTTTVTSGTTLVTFSVPYAAAPQVWQSQDNALWLTGVVTLSTGFFTSTWSALAAGTVNVYWESLGTVSSTSY